VTARWGRAAAALLLAVTVVAGCSSNDDKGASSTSSTEATADTVSLGAAARIVQRAAPDLPADQAAPLLRTWCAAARSGDRTDLVAQLRGLPSMTEPVLDEVLGALQKGAEQRCPDDAAARPDLLSQTYDELVSSPTTTAPTAAGTTGDGPTTTAASRTASARTGTTRAPRSTATTAAPTTTAASATTTTTDPCANVGGSTSGVMVGNGGAASCSHSGGG
jgi:hypothetical protein